MTTYYIDIDGKTKGPFTIDQLREMWSNGKITGKNRYCIEGGNKWTKLEMLQSVLEEKEVQTSEQNPKNYWIYFTIAIVVVIFAVKCGAQK